MTFVVQEMAYAGNVPARITIGTAETLEEAIKLVPGEVFAWEEDLQHPHHYDGAAMRGEDVFVFTIEPTK
jgi:hypothetical protein